MTSLPLAGLRVLSLAEQYPGPYATMILADLGADVILVERPGQGDPSRRFTGLFSTLNRNKRSVALDLKSDEGREAFLRLVDTADAVIEGFRPGVMARLKLDADTLRQRKPGLVFTSISSFGQTGPNANVAGHDLSIQAAAGMVNVAPGQEASAAMPVLPLADISSALFAALGIVTALLARTRTGRGASVDVSMHDCLVSWMAPFLAPPLNGLPVRPLPPPEPGYGVFATAEGRQITLSIAGEDVMWNELCELLHLPQFAGLNEAQRVARCAEIQPHVRSALAQRPHNSLCQQLEVRRIAFGPVLAAEEVLSHPHMLARRMATTVPGNKAGQAAQVFVRQPLVFDGHVGAVLRQAPALGEHNAELLGVAVGATARAA
jgi:crotonobetainyl-CoA:carnitine CoA-transferase CaiB-like acyl-CoA transferase